MQELAIAFVVGACAADGAGAVGVFGTLFGRSFRKYKNPIISSKGSLVISLPNSQSSSGNSSL